VFWLWLALGVVFTLTLLAVAVHRYLLHRYQGYVLRIFQERPLFIIPRGQPVQDAEEVTLKTPDGLSLRGCYFKTPAERRQGVILFGLEFGSNRWACLPYCDFLQANGFDIFTFEFRGQGDSEIQANYEPLQWVTDFEVRDMQTAIAYLRSRPDAEPTGIGFFGISKGGSAGLLAAARDPYLRCFVTDGIFATHSTMVPYMRKWVQIYSNRYWIQNLLPEWYYGLFARSGLRRLRRERGCRFPHLERAIAKLAPRPLLMIHGGADTYIKPEMAQVLFERARQPKQLWLVEGAKHNQSLQLAGDEYRRRVLEFFQKHLAKSPQEEYQPLCESLVLAGANGAVACDPVIEKR
jgi:pimeloyl-ACP methyl ester carboxylesterase